MKVSKAAHVEPGEAERQLKHFVDKFEPKYQKLIRAIQKALRARFPPAAERSSSGGSGFTFGGAAEMICCGDWT